ncbi:hypothetical protein CTA2_9998, partial [Colletotrichum tanaceti]
LHHAHRGAVRGGPEPGPHVRRHPRPAVLRGRRRQRHPPDHLPRRLGRPAQPDLLRLLRHHLRRRRHLQHPHPLLQRHRARRGRHGRQRHRLALALDEQLGLQQRRLVVIVRQRPLGRRHRRHRHRRRRRRGLTRRRRPLLLPQEPAEEAQLEAGPHGGERAQLGALDRRQELVLPEQRPAEQPALRGTLSLAEVFACEERCGVVLMRENVGGYGKREKGRREGVSSMLVGRGTGRIMCLCATRDDIQFLSLVSDDVM